MTDHPTPRTKAGREMMQSFPFDEWHPVNRGIVLDHILAIEAEARRDAVSDAANWPVCNERVPMTDHPTTEGRPPLLDVIVYERANGSEMPLREFLATLLIELWNEEEGFDPKRPLGTSMWWTTVVERLEEAGYEDADEDVKRAIRAAFEEKQS